ncbi:MAG: DUF3461 family protein [Pseudomonadota bacterium]|nr:DUF3461 family protein [Pseudomonadota bacterium]
MNDYPVLTEMGIARFDEIVHYTLRPEGKSKDVLKVYYKRKKGSLLPHSRKYKFGRAAKMVSGDKPGDPPREIFEISPYLQKALLELDRLAIRKHSRQDHKDKALADVDHLEKVMKAKLAELRAQIREL